MSCSEPSVAQQVHHPPRRTWDSPLRTAGSQSPRWLRGRTPSHKDSPLTGSNSTKATKLKPPLRLIWEIIYKFNTIPNVPSWSNHGLNATLGCFALLVSSVVDSGLKSVLLKVPRLVLLLSTHTCLICSLHTLWLALAGGPWLAQALINRKYYLQSDLGSIIAQKRLDFPDKVLTPLSLFNMEVLGLFFARPSLSLGKWRMHCSQLTQRLTWGMDLNKQTISCLLANPLIVAFYKILMF